MGWGRPAIGRSPGLLQGGRDLSRDLWGAPGGRRGLDIGAVRRSGSLYPKHSGGMVYGVPKGLLGCGLEPLVPSSLGRCGHVELGGLEFDGSTGMAGACMDGGNGSPGRWLGADLRPQASSYPRPCQVTDWSGELSLRARRGRAAELWLALCRPSPAPSLFCPSAAPGGRCVPLPTTSVPFVPSFERPARHPFLRQVSLLGHRLPAQLR